MRPLIVAGLGLVGVAGLLVGAGLYALHRMDELDILTSSYTTYQEAEAGKLFQRGWLPAIIPRSSRNIVEIHNIDTNEVCAAFEIDPSDRQSFSSALASEGFETYRGPRVLRQNFLRGRCPFGNSDLVGATTLLRIPASGIGKPDFFALGKDERNVYFWVLSVDPAV